MRVETTFDDRTPIEKLRKTQLIRMCQQRNIPVKWEWPKSRIMKLISGDEAAQEYRRLQGPSPEAVAEQKRQIEEMSFFELRAYVAELGLEMKKTDKKSDLLTKVMDYLNG